MTVTAYQLKMYSKKASIDSAVGFSPLDSHPLISPVTDLSISRSISPVSSRRPSYTSRTPLDHKNIQIVADIERGAPGDGTSAAVCKRNPEEILSAKRKNQYYGEVFSIRETPTSAKDRINKDALIMAEVKTNVIVRAAAH